MPGPRQRDRHPAHICNGRQQLPHLRRGASHPRCFPRLHRDPLPLGLLAGIALTRLRPLQVYLAAIVDRHAETGLLNPLTDAPPILDRVLAGIKRAAAGGAQPKLPITTAMLRLMKPHLQLQHRRDALVWVLMWTATAGLLGISEFHLHVDSRRQ